jgi:hypothetical protein
MAAESKAAALAIGDGRQLDLFGLWKLKTEYLCT